MITDFVKPFHAFVVVWNVTFCQIWASSLVCNSYILLKKLYRIFNKFWGILTNTNWHVMTWGRNDLRRIDLGAKRLGANRLGGETTGYQREFRTTLIARLSSVYLLFPCVMCKLIKTQFTLMCSTSKLNILPCLTSDYFALFGVNTHLDAIHPNTQSPQVSVLWYFIIRWFYSSGWVLVIERLMINLQKLLCLHI